MKLLHRILFAVAGGASAVVISACSVSGNETYADNLGPGYVKVGQLYYQVQIARELNPFGDEDSSYLQGLPKSELKLAPGQIWFAVFMQVRNPTNLPRPATPNITIEDTQNNRYLPIIPGPTNEFAYRAELVPANSLIPVPGTPASRGGTNGQLLLYKIKTTSLNNRPIEVRIIDPVTGKEAKAILDV